MNSVIVFDLANLRVVDAYKVNGSIVGSRREGDTVTLTLDRAPYRAEFTVDLPLGPDSAAAARQKGRPGGIAPQNATA